MKKTQLQGGMTMHRTIEGIYENGRITLVEKPAIKKAPVEVTFLDDTEELKLFTKMSVIFLHPIKVSRVRKLFREELHER